jgi:hypothetical protein
MKKLSVLRGLRGNSTKLRIRAVYTAEGAESAEGRAEEDKGRVRGIKKLSILRRLRGNNTKLRI